MTLEWPRGRNERRHRGPRGRGQRSGARVVGLGEFDELTGQHESLLGLTGLREKFMRLEVRK